MPRDTQSAAAANTADVAAAATEAAAVTTTAVTTAAAGVRHDGHQRNGKQQHRGNGDAGPQRGPSLTELEGASN